MPQSHLHSSVEDRPVCPVTEAQLRWAQFHHKQKARRIKTIVELLYQTPVSPSQVSGACSEDGNSSDPDQSQLPASTTTTRHRPCISRGRRALLRVSQRNYEQRRQCIQRDGYLNAECSFDEAEEEDAIATIFAEPFQQKQRRRRRRKRMRQTAPTTPGKEGDVSQFESALRAMMMTLQKSQRRRPDIQLPTKRWKRLGPSFQGYDDLKWGVIVPTRPVRNMGRGGSGDPSCSPNDSHYEDDEPERSERGNRQRSGMHFIGSSVIRRTQPPNLVFLERRKLFEDGTPSKENCEPAIIPLPPETAGFVKQFVAEIDKASRLEKLVSADGRLHKDNFAKLIRRYLGQAESQTEPAIFASPFALAKARKSAASMEPRRFSVEVTSSEPLQYPFDSSGLVRKFISQLEMAVNEETLVTDDGHFDRDGFELLVTRYLTIAAGQSLHEQEEEEARSWAQESLARSASVKNLLEKSPHRLGGGTALTRMLRKDNDRDSDEMLPSSSLIGLNHSDQIPKQGQGTGIAARIAGTVSNGLMKMLHIDDSSEQDRRAIAAFRNQIHNNVDDDSSLSSFKALPLGLINVVKNWRGQRNNERQEFADRPWLVEATSSLSESHQTIGSRAAASTLSPENLKEFHDRMSRQYDQSIIDTDGSDGSYTVNPGLVANLMLSPTILTKRHQQAIRAIESRNWEQVAYLMSANPWLAEMTDIKTNRYLLHSLAYYGGGCVDIDSVSGYIREVLHEPAPTQINTDLLRMFSSAVHKFDKDGNLPLHMAAASGNMPMIELLGDRFPGGASVRNEDGMLPLHLAILACPTVSFSALAEKPGIGVEIVRKVLSYFTSAVAVADNEGNLPIHTAASVLTGEIGMEIAFILLDEAERQVAHPDGVRFRNKLSQDEIESISMETASTAAPTDISAHEDNVIHSNMVRNNFGETPLVAAIHSHAGWEIIEAIACGLGGFDAARCCDNENNNALHLLASNDYKDPDAILSILKVAPGLASARNADGMLPIEVACMQMIPPDVLLSIVLVDLPIDLDCKHDVKFIDGRGASWWYLTCECDDYYVDIVEEVVSVCSYAQIRAICFVEGPNGDALIGRATPGCRAILQGALRFMGRFEFDEKQPLHTDNYRCLRIFEAQDFGEADDLDTESKRVRLKCFSNKEFFYQETVIMNRPFDFSLLQEVLTFTVGTDYWSNGKEPGSEHYFISIEQPTLTLGGVVRGMLVNEECQKDTIIRQRYALKVFAVLRIVCKALDHLHSIGLVHGKLNLETCCKFEDRWKLSSVLGCQQIGLPIRVSRLSSSAPPECFEYLDKGTNRQATFKTDYECTPALDSWSFGKLAYEVLIGEDLIKLDKHKNFEDDNRAMIEILGWSSINCDYVRRELIKVGVTEAGAELIAKCLDPVADHRPTAIGILNHRAWREIKE